MAANVASLSHEIAEMAEDRKLAAALLGGTRTMRKAGTDYLPRWPAEDQESYKARLETAVLFPAYSRTVQTLAAKPFSKPITLDNVPPDVEQWMLDIDREGRNLASFAGGIMEDALGESLCGILVDFPDTSTIPTAANGAPTLADERAAGVRPYWVHVKLKQILGVDSKVVSGQRVISRLRLMEEVQEADGEWGTKEVEQVRVLEPGKWTIYRKGAKKTWEEPVIHAEGVTSLSFVPFVPVYGKRKGFFEATLPLSEVAHLNVAHWQSASDQQTILHVSRVPILAVKGVQDKFKLAVGAKVALDLGSDPNADAFFVEHSGKAIEAGRQDLKDLEERMRQAGAELLVIDQKLTATQVTTENAVGMCALQRLTLDVQDALNLALDYTAAWAKIATAGEVKLFSDFGFGSLAEATAQIVKDMAAAGLISKQSAFEEQQRRGVISADITWEDERGRMDAEGPPLGMMGAPALPVA